MLKFKQKVKNSFNIASTTYDQVANIQYFVALQLVDLLKTSLPSFYPQTILDLGTGTGNLPIYLVKFFPNSKYTLNDLSENMLNIAIQKLHKNTKVCTILGDLETTIFNNHDLVISSFVLQWVNNLSDVLTKLYNKSKVFAFTCLLDGTFKELEKIFNKNNFINPTISKYPTERQLTKLLCELNPKKCISFSQAFNIKFSNIKEFFIYLKSLGATHNTSYTYAGKLKNIIVNSAKFSTNYNVFFAILIRE